MVLWEMEVEEIDAVLEKIWDLHDKLSDAIHSISRAHFIRSVKSSLRPNYADKKPGFPDSDDTTNRTGFVFVKGFSVDDSAIQEAKSLNAIRTALENLEDQLELFHTVQIQQRAERDAAIARLEQSRIVLALRLAEHQGKKYKVIEEARAFVGDVHDASRFASPENLYGSASCPSGENCQPQSRKGSNVFFKALISGLNFAKRTIKLDSLNGILGNAALVAVSMIAVFHLHQLSSKGRYILDPQRQEDNILGRNVTKVSRPEGSSSGGRSTHIDVLLARG